ncbi:ubiquitin-like protein [Theileria orientalis strain Shintoku]|uniref:Ubiquitin-like protein n=1 Tax=Theileria orientalis strain Shintoku TaxID=869250 RepID=J4C3F0_THEOR|nr:ubiquitin-like protein [Theileria orientalis strain Shintoku]BAM40326.1 ubiquitin-like protein [Theileria orientalis strain Shintoku]|eukprot:XP_009690627.1 ubiquitin-like protein [Theileria orientalis strain Shintoku]
MQVVVKTLTGKRQSFNFEPGNTVSQVKDVLRERECKQYTFAPYILYSGLDVNQIRLIYSGKQMNDELTLRDYKVIPGSTIHMVLQLRGG